MVITLTKPPVLVFLLKCLVDEVDNVESFNDCRIFLRFLLAGVFILDVVDTSLSATLCSDSLTDLSFAAGVAVLSPVETLVSFNDLLIFLRLFAAVAVDVRRLAVFCVLLFGVACVVVKL